MSPFVNIVTDLVKMLLVAVLTKLGYDVAAHSGDIAAVATEIGAFSVTAVVTLALVLWKWAQHSKLWNAVVNGPQIPQGGTGNALTGGSAVAGLILVACVLLLPGCTGMFATPTPSTPQDAEISKIDSVLQDYLLITTPVDAAIAAGDIKGTAADAVQTVESRVEAYFAAARTAALANDLVTADQQLALFQGDRAALVEVIADAGKKGTATAPATTMPS